MEQEASGCAGGCFLSECPLGGPIPVSRDFVSRACPQLGDNHSLHVLSGVEEKPFTSKTASGLHYFARRCFPGLAISKPRQLRLRAPPVRGQEALWQGRQHSTGASQHRAICPRPGARAGGNGQAARSSWRPLGAPSALGPEPATSIGVAPQMAARPCCKSRCEPGWHSPHGSGGLVSRAAGW